MSISLAPADRNVVLGVIAFQLDFLTRDQLIGALRAWSNDRAKSLGEWLVEHGVLNARRRNLLEPLVDEHLDQHDGEVRLSLAALAADRGSTQDVMERSRMDSEETAVVAGESSDLDATCEFGAFEQPTRLPFLPVPGALGSRSEPTAHYQHESAATRYALVRLHAKGGLGEVWVANDTELNREVAVKAVQKRHAQSAESVSRFLQESEITGGLEHPGVIPVYGRGRHADGRPFYAMRFIRGDSLKDAIDRFHSAPGGNDDPGERTLALRQLVTRVIAVCNTIAYAHSRGVLHRDLKPANILLGDYGETLVVDWGLAKPVGTIELAASEHGKAHTSGSPRDSSGTQMGSVVGTPAYMSPEQAEGRPDLVGPASDIYSLGATLFCILTGRPPFDDADLATTLRNVRKGHFPSPRALHPAIPRPLESICLRAMALRPEDRYDSPRGLADDLEHWLANEPVSCHREPATIRARRWMRKHRTWVTTGVAAVGVALLGLTSTLVVQAQSNSRLKTANAELRRSNEKEQRARAQAQERFGLAMDAVKSFYTGASEDVMLREPSLEGLRKRLLGSAMAFYNKFLTLLADDPSFESRIALADAFSRAASLTREIESVASSLPAEHQALALREALVKARPNDPVLLDDLADSLHHMAQADREIGALDEAIALLERARMVREDLVERKPASSAAKESLASVLDSLAGCEGQLGRATALKSALRSLEIRRKQASENPDNEGLQLALASGLQSLSELYRDLGQSDRALAPVEDTLRIREERMRSRPSGASSETEREFLFERIRLNNVLVLQGNLLSDLGRYKESLVAHERASQEWIVLAREYPTMTRFRVDQAFALFNMAYTNGSFGDSEESMRLQRQAIEIMVELRREQPEVVRFQRFAGRFLNALSYNLFNNGRNKECDETLRQSQEILESLARANPQDSEVQSEYARLRGNQGDFYLQVGRTADALTAMREALSVREQLSQAQPQSAIAQSELSRSLNTLGRALAVTGELEESIAQLRHAVEISEQLYREHPDVREYRHDLPRALNALGGVLQQANHPDEALRTFERALEVRASGPLENPVELYSLACTLARCGSLAPSEEGRRYADRAMEALQKSVAGGFRNALFISADSDLESLHGRRDFQELIADLRFPGEPFAR